MPRLIDLAHEVAESATRVDNALLGRLASLVASTPGLRAAAYDAERTSPLWCWDHERDLAHCRRAGLPCDGESIASHDSTGDAAAQRAADVIAIGTELVNAYRALEHLTRLLARYPEYQPATPAEPPGAKRPAPAGACRSCWRDDEHYEEIAVGQYRDWCRWCGDFRRVHGWLPPVELLRKRHQGQRITVQDVAAAKSQRRGRKVSA